MDVPQGNLLKGIDNKTVVEDRDLEGCILVYICLYRKKENRN